MSYQYAAGQPGGIVTGEAVALDLRIARAGSRALAFGIDLCVVIGLLIGAMYLLGVLLGSGDAAIAAAIVITTIVGIFVGVPVTQETLTRGRTLGKLALGLRVVRDDGGPVRFRQSFVRGLVGMFELYLFACVPALIASLLSSRGKRVGDLLAGTVVLQERVPARESAAVTMPPPLAGWAANADLSRIPDQLALAARQYLGRARELTPQASAQMEAQLAGAIYELVAPPPPPGTPGWALLAAVISERRRREEARLGVGANAPASMPAPLPTPPTTPPVPTMPPPSAPPMIEPTPPPPAPPSGPGDFAPPA